MDRELTPELLLSAYASGIFPMAESQSDLDIHWVDPSRRGIIPLDGFHISRSLQKVMLNGNLTPRFNTDFVGTVAGCADREETWINETIHNIYMDLHKSGHAYSQEIWDNDELVGGVYGVALGAAFFGESMFSRRPNASKIALAFLVDRLRLTGFELFDTQFLTPHLKSLGAVEIGRSVYLEMLETAVAKPANIKKFRKRQSAQDVIQRSTQTS